MKEDRDDRPDVVVECEAVPFDLGRGTCGPRRFAPWVTALALLFPVLGLLIAFRFVAGALALMAALARHPVGLALLAAGAMWFWYAWRDRRLRQRF